MKIIILYKAYNLVKFKIYFRFLSSLATTFRSWINCWKCILSGLQPLIVLIYEKGWSPT